MNEKTTNVTGWCYSFNDIGPNSRKTTANSVWNNKKSKSANDLLPLNSNIQITKIRASSKLMPNQEDPDESSTVLKPSKYAFEFIIVLSGKYLFPNNFKVPRHYFGMQVYDQRWYIMFFYYIFDNYTSFNNSNNNTRRFVHESVSRVCVRPYVKVFPVLSGR